MSKQQEAMQLALEALIAEYHMENSSFAKRVDCIFKEALAEQPAQRTWVGLTDEEMQRMAKRIEELEAMLERQTSRIVDLQTHIENLEGEQT